MGLFREKQVQKLVKAIEAENAAMARLKPGGSRADDREWVRAMAVTNAAARNATPEERLEAERRARR